MINILSIFIQPININTNNSNNTNNTNNTNKAHTKLLINKQNTHNFLTAIGGGIGLHLLFFAYSSRYLHTQNTGMTL